MKTEAALKHLSFNEQVRIAEQMIQDSIQKTVNKNVVDHERILIGELADWLSSLNRHLLELASQKKIKLKPGTNLVQIALESAVKAGARGRQDIQDVAMESISRVVGRSPTEGGISGYNADYVRNTILCGLVGSLKADGRTLAQVQKDERVQEIVKTYRIRSQTVERYYRGDVLPNRTLKQVKEFDLNKSHSRADIFSAFDPKREREFEAFFRRAVTNQARDTLRERNRLKNKIINDAARIGPDVASGDIDPERTPELGVDEHSKTEARMLAHRLREELGHEPQGKKYLVALDLMKNENADLTDPADTRKFERALGLSTEELRQFQRSFLRDLSKVFQRLGVEDFESAEQVMKVAARKPYLIREIEHLWKLADLLIQGTAPCRS